MKRDFRGSQEPDWINAEFTEALCGGDSNENAKRRQAERKARQFCRQVQRALNLALGGEWFVEEVVPAPDCGRLMVYVASATGADVSELRRETARLRAEVAGAITRKRTPELFFVPVEGMGGGDE
ncbi:MAG: hypothetical protein HY821_02080 [Acidobacteria bacterium]|nr:hypothetical protein [Acidobacteriota bacterium]